MPMSSRTRRRSAIAGVGGVAVIAAAALLQTSLTNGAQAVVPPFTSVDFHGYSVQVPDDWKVVDLAKNPDTCVRFDKRVVYLGTPGDQASCPSDLRGRTTAMLVQPLSRRAADAAPRATTSSAKAPSAGGTIQVANEQAGVLVTATHGTNDESVVRRILKTAKVTGDGAKPTRLSDLRAKSKSSKDVTPQAVGPQPGTYQGEGFDACAAPSQGAMDAWAASPFRTVGVYISGPVRACAQPNLTPEWVQKQVDAGWHLIPIEVGPQAPCSDFGDRFSEDPATARAQGAERAKDSVRAAQELGIPAGSALYNDIEGYPRGGACTTAVRSFVSGWTDELHAQGYLSGVYSSGGSGVIDLDESYDDPNFTRPDHIWFAWWNDQANTDGGQYVSADHWADGQRIHQYKGGHDETHGGVTINIDSNFLDVKEGNPQPPSECTKAKFDFASYPALKGDASGDEVKAVQCLLKSAGLYEPEPPTGKYDEPTTNGVKAFQKKVGLPESGEVDAKTWTALLSAGSTPVIQQGASGEAVTRLQRALTAALGRDVGIDGAFGPNTDKAVREYQTARGLDVDGIVGANTWKALQTGQ